VEWERARWTWPSAEAPLVIDLGDLFRPI
jgi:hypothetical protein